VFRITPDGEITVFADDDRLRGAAGNVVAPDGTLYQSAYTAGAVLRITPDGTVEDYAIDGIAGPMGIVIDPGGNGIYVADCTSDTVVRVDAAGNATDFADDPRLDCPTGLAMDDAGNVYAANFSDGRVLKITPDGNVSELAVVPGDNNAHLAFHDGLLYLVGRGAHQIFTITLDGGVDVLAGTGARGIDDGPGSEATFSLPNGIAVGPDGSLYVNQVAAVDGNRNFPTAVRKIAFDASGR
jgi:sugar lactone lactonase YvrE